MNVEIPKLPSHRASSFTKNTFIFSALCTKRKPGGPDQPPVHSAQATQTDSGPVSTVRLLQNFLPASSPPLFWGQIGIFQTTIKQGTFEVTP
eukprot:4277016-Amphidinium_carterae.1